MMARRRNGFTLIELLVVISIIAILAAMLFPVFARARESARKIQCLSNVKNIAMAVQIYLTDYDRLWPAEHRAEVNNGFVTLWSKSLPLNTCGADATSKMNPYLKPAVILDEYIKNRDVWRCPSARSEGSYSILNPYGGDWWAVDASLAKSGADAAGFGQCGGGPYPPGWGGSVTDSLRQGTGADGPDAFHNSISTIQMRDVKTSTMDDPARFVVVGEGTWPITDPVILSYPDASRMCGANPGSIACCGGNSVDWVNCSFSVDCGAADNLDYSDVQVRKQYGKGRHLGGVNVGFADGHASWFNSEAILDTYAWDDPSRQGIMDPSQWAARQARQGLWTGFVDGICKFNGAFGAP